MTPEPVKDITAAFDRLESRDFAISVLMHSSWRQARRAMENEPAVALLRLHEDRRFDAEIVRRLVAISTPSEGEYANDLDAAAAVYLSILEARRSSLLQIGVIAARRMSRTWWVPKALEDVTRHLRDRGDRSDAGEAFVQQHSEPPPGVELDPGLQDSWRWLHFLSDLQQSTPSEGTGEADINDEPHAEESGTSSGVGVVSELSWS